MRLRSQQCRASLIGALAFAATLLAAAIGAGAEAQTTVGTLSPGLAEGERTAAPPLPVVAVPQRAPVQPRSPSAAKAYLVLETYCARCHQAGRGNGRPADAGLANILDLDEIARVPSLVRPGHPDGSDIYVRLLRQHVASAADDDRPPALPTASDVEAVRDWIQSLGGGGGAATSTAAEPACKGRTPIADEEIGRAMAGWLAVVGPERARETRFISLAHLHNACASEADLAGYRQAVAKTLNLVSWAEAPVRPESVGDQLALLAVRLADLGWLAAHWERIARAAPGGAAPSIPAEVADAVGTATPVVRGDWLASAALRAPLYGDLLALPPTLGELARLIKAEPVARKGDRARRMAVRTSAVVRGQRLIDRIAAGQRPAWIAYDLPGGGEGRDVFEAPLGLGSAPAGATGSGSAASRGDLRPETQRLLFTLPNGLPAFAAFDADGRRLDEVPAAAPVRTAAGAASGTAVAAGCLSCHGKGAVATRDDMRAHLDSDKSGLDRETKAAALLLYLTGDEARQMFDADAERMRAALTRAGLDPDLTVHGLEITRALARQHDLPVGLERAAAEFALPVATFAEHLKSFDGPADMQALAMRLLQGVLARGEAEALYVALRGGGSAAAVTTGALPLASAASAETAGGAPSKRPAGGAGGVTVLPPGRGESRRLTLWSERPRYGAGELLTLNVTTAADCHLTVVGVDAKGKATVLFPNDFEQDNLVRGGRVHRFPAAEAAYQLRLSQTGKETLIAVCDPFEKTPIGIQHDFERQRFTVLGNWRNFLRGAVEAAAEDRRDPERAVRARRVAQARGERRIDSRAELSATADGPPGDWAWSAIQVPVD